MVITVELVYPLFHYVSLWANHGQSNKKPLIESKFAMLPLIKASIQRNQSKSFYSVQVLAMHHTKLSNLFSLSHLLLLLVSPNAD
jgi:hypothetical protein